MTNFQQFESAFKENIYTINEYDINQIKLAYKNFIEFSEESEKQAIQELRNLGLPIPDDIISILRDKDYENENDYQKIIIEGLNIYFNEAFKKDRLDSGGICLKSQLIGKACQMRFNEDMLGVIRNIDEEHPRYLFVDFGDEDEVKIDIDELIISGQKL